MCCYSHTVTSQLALPASTGLVVSSILATVARNTQALVLIFLSRDGTELAMKKIIILLYVASLYRGWGFYWFSLKGEHEQDCLDCQ